MTQENKIEKALQMIKNFDWDWRMCDLGYFEERKKAERRMRSFVALVCTIPNKAVREALRNLWTLEYRKIQYNRGGNKTEYIEKKKEYMAVLAL